MRKKVRELIERGTLLSGSLSRLNQVCKLLSKPTEMKSEGNNEYFRAISPLLTIFPMKIHGQDLTENELKIVSKFCTYVKKEPGEVLCEHGIS